MLASIVREVITGGMYIDFCEFYLTFSLDIGTIDLGASLKHSRRSQATGSEQVITNGLLWIFCEFDKPKSLRYNMEWLVISSRGTKCNKFTSVDN